MSRDDSLESLEHDHAALNRRVLELGGMIARIERGEIASAAAVVGDCLTDLRDELFLHFVREEEGLFPFLARLAPELEQRVGALAAVHDEICGAIARMVHLVEGPHLAVLVPVFHRFEAAYARHAHVERELFALAETRLTAEQRRELAEWIRGI
jgi:iron-sulfur cluster repair protein YtfE (RIC family)